jgi:hypothetical protein
MLTRVPVGQVRFNLPGLSADTRGAAVGRDLLLRFGTLDRLVGFLRLLSAERTPEDLWGGLRIVYARPANGAREAFVRVANPGGATADLVASTARLAGGAPFTGTSHHFVPARDSRSPLGYDAAVVSHGDGDFTLYTDDVDLAFREEGQLQLERLLLRLELRRFAGGAEAAWRAARRSPVYLAVRRGLAPVMVEYLFGAGIEAQVAVCEPPRSTPFSAAPTFWLFRIAELPGRLAGLCTRTPGLDLYLPVLDDVLVAAGYEHPVHLASCRAALRGERLLLLGPPPRPVIEVSPRPTFAALDDVVKLRVPVREDARASMTAPPPAGALEVPLRLEPVANIPARPRAALVPWSRAAWLRRLLFALPAAALRSYRVAFVEAGVLVVAGDRLEGLPFGQLLEEAIPGVFVPVGRRLRPALSPGLLAERLGVSDGAVCVFPDAERPPFRIAREAFDVLERKTLARSELPWSPPVGARPAEAPPADAPPPPEIENDPLGLLPLWGWRS